MIKVMTSTCLRDISYLNQLNKQLISHNIEHYIFVEEKELEYFKHLLNVHIKLDNGDNGGGRDGTMVRWDIYQQMINILQEGDTCIQMDSDVYFGTEKMFNDLHCKENEIKGFFTWEYLLDVNKDKFHHMSGMLIAASKNVFTQATKSTRQEMYNLCTYVLDNGVCPSEDVMLSYLLQIRGGGTIVNFSDKFSRHMGKDYNTQYDVIC